MPKAFDNCQKRGGKIRTSSFGGQSYRRICYINDKSYQGELHKKKSHK